MTGRRAFNESERKEMTKIYFQLLMITNKRCITRTNFNRKVEGV